jgi:hypothetical protein
MLESFLQAQKVAVRRVLQRKFRKYVTFGEETNQLLLHQLRSLVNDHEKFRAVSFDFLCVCVLSFGLLMRV